MIHQVFYAPPPPPPLPPPQGIVNEPDEPPLQRVLVDNPHPEVQVLEIPLPAEEVEGEQGIIINANAGALRGAVQNRGLRRSKLSSIKFNFISKINCYFKNFSF